MDPAIHQLKCQQWKPSLLSRIFGGEGGHFCANSVEWELDLSPQAQDIDALATRIRVGIQCGEKPPTRLLCRDCFELYLDSVSLGRFVKASRVALWTL